MPLATFVNAFTINDEIAAANRRTLAEAGVFAVHVAGVPGSGKTAFIEATIRRLGHDARAGVIVANLAAQRDAKILSRVCNRIVPIDIVALEAQDVRQALKHLPLRDMDLLFIEAADRPGCAVDYSYGQDVKLALFSAGGGDDKAAEDPYLLAGAQLVVLNKIDLLQQAPFDHDAFVKDVKHFSPSAGLLEVSALHGAGMDAWLHWLNAQRATKPRPAGAASPAVPADWYFG